jgi:hypothetical protein
MRDPFFQAETLRPKYYVIRGFRARSRRTSASRFRARAAASRTRPNLAFLSAWDTLVAPAARSRFPVPERRPPAAFQLTRAALRSSIWSTSGFHQSVHDHRHPAPQPGNGVSMPGTGRICLIRSVVVRTLLTGGAEKGPSFSYSLPSLRSDPDFRFCRIDPVSRASPARVLDQPVPRRLRAGESSWRRYLEVVRNRAGRLIAEAGHSRGQLLSRAKRFDAGAFRSRRLARHARGQRNHRKRHQSCRGESSVEWSIGGSSARRRDLGLRIRRLLLGFGSRRSVESRELPFGAYRQMLARGWGGLQMPCVFKALQLQRLRSRMS